MQKTIIKQNKILTDIPKNPVPKMDLNWDPDGEGYDGQNDPDKGQYSDGFALFPAFVVSERVYTKFAFLDRPFLIHLFREELGYKPMLGFFVTLHCELLWSALYMRACYTTYDTKSINTIVLFVCPHEAT